VQGAAVPRVRQSVLLDARRRENLTQLQPAMRAMAAEPAERQSPSRGDASEERARRIAAWENWIGAWERGVDAQSAPYIPPLARAVGVDPLALFDVDLAGRPFTALRMAAGLTLQALSEAAEYDAAERTQHSGPWLRLETWRAGSSMCCPTSASTPAGRARRTELRRLEVPSVTVEKGISSSPRARQ
jgi:transcriptional regulator with XRE-family HTH domain